MPLGRYVLGTVELGLLVLGAISVARTLRRRLVPQWRGPHALLATTVLALSTTCLVLQLLGAVSGLRGWALAASGAALLAVTPKGLKSLPLKGSTLPADSRWRRAVVLGLLAGLATVWAVQTRIVLLHGVLDIDSLTYHLPFAQAWAKSHRVGPLIHVAPGTPVQYYPGNDELLHASGLVAYGREVLGPFLNAAWLALLVLSAFCLGLRRGRATSLLALAVIVGGGPLIARFLPGAAMSDVASLAAVLAMAALLLEAFDSEQLHGLAIAGAAAGLAVGIKLTVLPLLGIVTLGLLLLTRVRTWLPFAVGLAVPAAFWYLRDLVLTGSPVPFLAVPGLPTPGFSVFDHNAQSVLHYATDGHVLRTVYVPQTYDVLGPAWWLLAALTVVGVVVGLRSHRGPFQVLAAATLVGGLAYLVTPTTAGGPEGRPLLFAVDVRYALPTLLLGAALVPLLVTDVRARVVGALLVLGAAATLLAPWRLTTELDQKAWLTGVVGLAVGVLAWWRLPRPGRRTAVALGAVAVVALLPLASLAQDRAYRDDRSPAAFRWAQTRSGLTVAVTGNLRLSPYTGAALGNRVHYLGRVQPDGGFEDYRTCQAWRAAAVRDHADAYVVDRFARTWVDDPAFVDQVPNVPGAPRLVRLVGAPDPATCPAKTT